MALADLHSEELVLSCFMRDQAEVGGRCIEAGMTRDWFTDPENQTLYRHLLGIWSEGKPIERFAIVISLKQSGLLEDAGGADKITRLIGLQGNKDAAGVYIERVRDCYRRRRLHEATKSAFMDTQGEKSVDEIEFDLHKILDASDRTVDMPTPKAMSLSLLDRSEGTDSILTGFGGIDRYAGPLYRGDFLVIGAKRKSGKSIFAGNIAAKIAKRDFVVFFSAEMGKLEVWKRMSCAESGISAKYWKPGWTGAGELVGQMNDTLHRMKSLKIGIIDSVVDIDQAVAICRSLKARHGSLGAIVFDYLQLFHAGSDKRASRAELVSSVSRSCKRAAVDLNTLVVGISQLNDDGLSLDSRGIERDCNLMLNIDDDRNVFVAANRNGPQGVKLNIEAQLELCRFIEN